MTKYYHVLVPSNDYVIAFNLPLAQVDIWKRALTFNKYSEDEVHVLCSDKILTIEEILQHKGEDYV